MMIKLDIYRKFTNALAAAVIVSVGWICYEVIHRQKHISIGLSTLTTPSYCTVDSRSSMQSMNSDAVNKLK